MTVPEPSFRRRLEVAAGPLVVVLARLPKIAPFLIVLTLLLLGLFLGGLAGGLVLLVLAGFLGLLLFLSWPALEAQPRLLRLAVVALVVVRAATLII